MPDERGALCTALASRNEFLGIHGRICGFIKTILWVATHGEMPFAAFRLDPAKPFDLNPPAGVTFVIRNIALAARLPTSGTSAAVWIKPVGSPEETILCTLMEGRKQFSCLGKPLLFTEHGAAIISVKGAAVDICGQVVMTPNDDAHTDTDTDSGGGGESDGSVSDGGSESDDFVNEFEKDEEDELLKLPRASAAKTTAVKAQVYESFISSGMSPSDAKHFVDTMPQCLIDSANPLRVGGGDVDDDGNEDDDSVDEDDSSEDDSSEDDLELDDEDMDGEMIEVRDVAGQCVCVLIRLEACQCLTSPVPCLGPGGGAAWRRQAAARSEAGVSA